MSWGQSSGSSSSDTSSAVGPLSDADALKIASGVRETLASLDAPALTPQEAAAALAQPPSSDFDYLFNNAQLDGFTEEPPEDDPFAALPRMSAGFEPSKPRYCLLIAHLGFALFMLVVVSVLVTQRKQRVDQWA
jgi:hypothetical protein